MTQAAGKQARAGRLLLIGAVVITIISIGYSVSREKPKPEVATPAPLATTAPNPDDIIRALQEKVGANPKDAESWQQLGWAYFETGRYTDAVRAYRRTVDLVPGNATFWSSLGEAMVMASERDPMPIQAAQAFDKAIALDPKDPRARYFQAVRKDLKGEHKAAIDDWLALLKDTPPGAPWEKDLRRTIEQAAKIAGLDVSTSLATSAPAQAHPPLSTAAIPGPTRAQMQAAAALPKGAQDQMIQGMVESLEGKLRANPGNIEGWIMLMRSRVTLGEMGKAAVALKSAIAANPAQAARLKEEARAIDVPGA